MTSPSPLGRTRTERMHRFDDLSDVPSTLQHLMRRVPPLVKMLFRQPRTKEPRYVHLLAGDVDAGDAVPPAVKASVSSPLDDRTNALEEAVWTLEKRVSEIEQQLANFRKRFE